MPAGRRRYEDGLSEMAHRRDRGGLLLPPSAVLVLVVFSFNDSKFSVDWRGFTLQWYQRLLERPDILRGLKASLIVGGAATIISAVFGTLLALALGRQQFRGRRVLEGFLYVPIVTPEIVTGISLLLLFVLLKFPLGLATITIAHVAFCISFVVIVVLGTHPGNGREPGRSRHDPGR